MDSLMIRYIESLVYQGVVENVACEQAARMVAMKSATENADDLIGELPHRWNHLVDYDPPLPADELSNLHFTSGGPWFDEFKDCGYADLWFAERHRMLSSGGNAP